MELLSFIRQEPLIAWFGFLALLLTLVPAASVVWRRLTGRDADDKAKPPAKAIEQTRFGNQIDLVMLFLGLAIVLAVIAWVAGNFLG